jgi:MFS family permease
VLAIYSSGIYIGGGIGMLIGGQIVERWDAAFAASGAPFGLAGWQVAFFAVGLPGLLLAVWVRSLREPRRGQADGILAPEEPHPFRAFLLELRAVLPGLSLLHLRSAGASGRTLAANLVAALAIGAAAALLVWATGSLAQWIALGIGVYAAASWAQALRLRDPPTAQLVLETPALRDTALGLAFLAFTGYGLGYWLAPYFVRVHGAPEGEVGTVLGLSGAFGGWLGVTLGGILADRLRERSPSGRLQVALLTAALPVPFALWLLATQSTALGYALTVPVNVFGSMWIGVGASTVQDLVLPRMRASASAVYLLVITFIGMALGPYTIGQISDATRSLRSALLVVLLSNALAALFLWRAMRTLPEAERTLRARAAAAGEPGL